MINPEFVEELPAAKRGAQQQDHAKLIAQLKSNPGVWALIRRPLKKDCINSKYAFASNLKRRVLQHFGEGLETAVREGSVYARWNCEVVP